MFGPWLRLLATILIVGVSLQGEVLHVPRDYVSIKSAVFAAAAGDIIEVDDGYYFEGDIVIKKAITIRAKNAFRPVVYGDVESGFTEAIFIIRAPASIEGLILKNGFRGILQRGSPDVSWTAANLAILNMRDEAIQINAVEGNIGRGTVRGVMIDNCGTGISTNDAYSLDVSHCLVANCGRAFSGYNHIQFEVDQALVWNCRQAFEESEDRLPPPRCSTIARGANVEVVDAGAARDDPTKLSAGNDFMDSGRPTGGGAPGVVGRGLALAIAGDVHFRTGSCSQSLPFYEAALKSGQESGAEEVSLKAHTGLALANEQLGDFPAALENYRKAILLLERFRGKLPLRVFQPGFLQDKAKVYLSFIHFLYEMHERDPRADYLEEAFACAERSRARGFLDSLEETGLDFASGVSPEIISEGKRLSEEVSRYQLELQSQGLPPARRSKVLAELEKVENAYRDLMIRMRRNIPGYADRLYPGPVGYREIRAELLPPGTGLAEFVLGNDYSFAFWASRDSLSLVQLPPGGELLPLVQRYLKFMTLKNSDRFMAEGGSRRLFDILLGPLRAEMAKGIEKIIIVPDGHLYYLPFESLMIEGLGNDREGRYLIEDFEISYAPSASALVRLAARSRYPSSRKDLVAVSVPEPRDSRNFLFGHPIGLSKLKHAGEEIDVIGRFFTQDNRKILDGPRAAEGRLKRFPLGEFRYIHFAVHGIFDDKNWRRSGLLLWREKGSAEDGILQLRDIYLLDLHSDLVVLSACQSGRSNIDTGEGITGLTGGFLFAGSRAVLVSLWNIADRSTAEFMGNFYGHLKEGKSPSKALQEAKKEMIRSPYGHPLYWAAFVLIGDAGSYSISK
jgi:CHAT domain-containing protein/tetratricopeptide (TPR) repeat protein